jgi:hypothetical protein
MKRNPNRDTFLGAEAAIGPLFFGAAGVSSVMTHPVREDAPLLHPPVSRVVGMRLLLPPVSFDAGDLLSIDGGRYARIAVERGELWLTQADDTRDIVLRAGEAFVLEGAGTALVQSRGPAAVSIAVARASALPRIRITRGRTAEVRAIGRR